MNALSCKTIDFGSCTLQEIQSPDTLVLMTRLSESRSIQPSFAVIHGSPAEAADLLQKYKYAKRSLPYVGLVKSTDPQESLEVMRSIHPYVSESQIRHVLDDYSHLTNARASGIKGISVSELTSLLGAQFLSQRLRPTGGIAMDG